MNRRKRGFRAERELVQKLWSRGFAVIRGPASGSGARKIFYPDVVAIYKGNVYVFEVKYRSNKDHIIYLDKEKVRKLKDFAARANAQTLLAVRFKGGKWYIIPLDSQSLEDVGTRYKVNIQKLKAIELEEFIRNVVNNRLDKYINNSAG
ncbi:Holliday junction resolvase Hjc [Pyrofollis japonicus]|uniref:Holliday junction resolvase Hjc n=1 Tax=Pyrofollis japonicus TaxID=3060460 RepID=UPI00295B56F3|nr:Holliday junction resolvase Hjc [Pyrofollis japonicus]BEP17559.1 Holliday junction resolvase Hjc [Pyrofollis japonicus]